MSVFFPVSFTTGFWLVSMEKKEGKAGSFFFFLFPFLGTDNVLCRDTSIPDALNSSTPLEAFGNGSHSFAEWLPLVMTSG